MLQKMLQKKPSGLIVSLLIVVITLSVWIFDIPLSTKEKNLLIDSITSQVVISSPEVSSPESASSSASEPPISQSASTSTTSSALQSYTITRIIDGDTVELDTGETVRYIGIDTPETRDPRRGVECYGPEASKKNQELVLNREVKLEKDVSETDRYGRLLRYVYLDGQLINETLVREGFALAADFPPDVKYSKNFHTAQNLAQQEEKGLWGALCAPKPVLP